MKASPQNKFERSGPSKTSKSGSSGEMNVKPIARRSIKGVKKSIVKNFSAAETHDYRWDELRSIEKRRRGILLRVDDPVWKTLLTWDGTVIQILAGDFLFWVTIVIYVGIRLLAHYGELPPDLDEFPVDSITVLGGFLSFFLVFWVNQSNDRYFSLYEQSMGCKGRIFDAASIAVTTLPYAQASRLVRYMNAAHALGYVGLSEVYPSGNYFKYINQTMGLLTEQEWARLEDIDMDKGGSCTREVIVWCMNEVEAARVSYLVVQFC